MGNRSKCTEENTFPNENVLHKRGRQVRGLATHCMKKYEEYRGPLWVIPISNRFHSDSWDPVTGIGTASHRNHIIPFNDRRRRSKPSCTDYQHPIKHKQQSTLRCGKKDNNKLVGKIPTDTCRYHHVETAAPLDTQLCQEPHRRQKFKQVSCSWTGMSHFVNSSRHKHLDVHQSSIHSNADQSLFIWSCTHSVLHGLPT